MSEVKRQMMRMRPWLLLVLVVALFRWSGNQWVSTRAAENPRPEQTSTSPPARPEQTSIVVGISDIDHTILLNGELRAARSRDITAPNIRSAFGSAVTFLAPEGSHVKQGQRILEYDASALTSQQSEAKRKLDEAKLKIEKTKADLEATRADLLNELAQAEGTLKVAELYGKISKDLLPANTHQKYQLDLDKAKLALDKAKEKLANHDASIAAQLALVELDKAQAELDLKKIEGDLAVLQVDAPLDGIILYGDNWANNRKIQVGDTLFPGMPVVLLPDLTSMQVIGFVYDTELRYLSAGMVCDLRLDTAPGKVWRGKILSLTSVASRKGFASQHKVFRAVVAPDSIDLALMKPGMTVRIEVPVSLASQVPSIPREYLAIDAQGRYFVRKGSDSKTATIQIVKVGAFNDRRVQIVQGLKAGDPIVHPSPPAQAKS